MGYTTLSKPLNEIAVHHSSLANKAPNQKINNRKPFSSLSRYCRNNFPIISINNFSRRADHIFCSFGYKIFHISLTNIQWEQTTIQDMLIEFCELKHRSLLKYEIVKTNKSKATIIKLYCRINCNYKLFWRLINNPHRAKRVVPRPFGQYFSINC